jgi:hypothetical protein
MEEKRGIKRSRSSRSGSSSSSSNASMPPLSPSESLLPPVSLLDVSSRRPPSPVCEHGGPSEEIPVVELSSDEEENALPNTSRDEEFIQRLFGDLNHGLLGPLSDGNVIILSDSNEEEEVHEEVTVEVEAAPPSDVNSPATSVSITDANDAPIRVQDDNSDGGDKSCSPYAVTPKGVSVGSVLLKI